MEKDDEGNMSKNSKQLRKFVLYCLDNPNQRFYQALRNWSGNAFILKADDVVFDKKSGGLLLYKNIRDTFYD